MDITGEIRCAIASYELVVLSVLGKLENEFVSAIFKRDGIRSKQTLKILARIVGGVRKAEAHFCVRFLQVRKCINE